MLEYQTLSFDIDIFVKMILFIIPRIINVLIYVIVIL